MSDVLNFPKAGVQLHHFQGGLPPELEVYQKLVIPAAEQRVVAGQVSGPENYWAVTVTNGSSGFSGALLVARTTTLIHNVMMDNQYGTLDVRMTTLGETPPIPRQRAAAAVIYANLSEAGFVHAVHGHDIPRELVDPLGQIGMKVLGPTGHDGHVAMGGDSFPVLNQAAKLLR